MKMSCDVLRLPRLTVCVCDWEGAGGLEGWRRLSLASTAAVWNGVTWEQLWASESLINMCQRRESE